MLACFGSIPACARNWSDCAGKLARAGSIPACAGEPKSCSQPRLRARVYPRMCGGTVAKNIKVRPNKVLSPRVRGNHHVRAGALDRHGSIPARAGGIAALKFGA